jgi:hypothetical protein
MNFLYFPKIISIFSRNSAEYMPKNGTSFTRRPALKKLQKNTCSLFLNFFLFYFANDGIHIIYSLGSN